MALLTTLVSFNGKNGSSPYGSLLIDAAGNLFGTTHNGGTSDGGTIFELARSGSGYAATTTILASLQATSGTSPFGNLVVDSAGNLLTATTSGGASNRGTILLLAKTATGYASTPTVLVSNTVAQGAATTQLSTDTAGNVFGTTSTGIFSTAAGTLFELARNGAGYASSTLTLGSFTAAQGAYLGNGVVLDAAGNIFGTTTGEGNGVASVFEVARTATGYAAPATLASFTNALAFGALDIDAAGNLFGTTETGGANGNGSVFELARTGSGYASTVTTLVSFTGSNGINPLGAVLVDAAGNLFGTTINTVFEVVRSGAGYLGTPVTLATFTGTNGSSLQAGLTVDAAGNLFGTTSSGGAGNLGTVFQLSGSGFIVGHPGLSGTTANQSVQGRTPVTPFSGVTLKDTTVTAQTLTVSLSAAANGTLGNLGGGSYNAATGVYAVTGTAATVTAALDGLVFTPAFSNTGNVATSFTIADNDGAGGLISDATTTVTSINPNTIGVPVFRFYNPTDQGHFFTSSPSEVAQVLAGPSGLQLEGPAFNSVNPATDPAAMAVYRFYQSSNNSHFYTDSLDEVKQLQATRPDMTLEGPDFYVDPTMQAGDTAVYRYYETRSETHLYINGAAEMAAIKATRPDLVLEGPAFYIKA